MGDTHDPRHQKRIARMQALFAFSFDRPTTDLTPATSHDPWADAPELATFPDTQPTIDGLITQFATEHKLEDISRVDVSILRCILFEWLTTNTPKKVLIDEAVELAKTFGSTNSPKFVNGVLQSVLDNEHAQATPSAA